MNNTLHNGFMVLEYLAERGDAVTVKEIAGHFQLPNSHICRLLKSLTEIGYVEQLAANRKYQVSLKILNLANARLQKERLPELARPDIKQLAAKLDAAVYITHIYCGYSLIIGVEYPPLFPSADEVAIGTLHSPTDSACGQLCAAYSESEVRAQLLEKIDWDAPGDYQNKRAEFEAELENIRQRGYALRDLKDVAAAAVPLFQAGNIFNGALGVMLPPGRVQANRNWQEVIEAVASCGKLISSAQGCSGGKIS